MQHDFWTKTTNFKLFGKTIFTKEEIGNETSRDSEYTIIVTQDYFNKEFDLNKKNEKK